jgi:hypothetical protein
MAATLKSVTIFDEVLYQPGHMVHQWVGGITRKYVIHAKARAPMRSGTLKAGIRGTTRRTGVKRVDGNIHSRAKHTMYVLRGTGHPVKGHAGFIYSTEGFFAVGNEWPGKGRKGVGKGEFMHLKPTGPIAHRVRGQEPNNFLEAAWRATARNHRAIRGIPFPLRF